MLYYSFTLIALDAIHEAEFEAVGVVVGEGRFVGVVNLLTEVGKEDAEVLRLVGVVFQRGDAAKRSAVVLEHFCILLAGIHKRALKHEIPMGCELPVELRSERVVMNLSTTKR